MCTQKPPHDYSNRLYERYREALNKYITSKARALQPRSPREGAAAPLAPLTRPASPSLLAGASRAAREARRAHAARAGEALGEPQADGALAEAHVRLPGPLLHQPLLARAAAGRGHALLPRPGVRDVEGSYQGRRAGADRPGAGRGADRPLAGEARAGPVRGDGHGLHGRLRGGLRGARAGQLRPVLRGPVRRLGGGGHLPRVHGEGGGVPAIGEGARGRLPARQQRWRRSTAAWRRCCATTSWRTCPACSASSAA